MSLPEIDPRDGGQGGCLAPGLMLASRYRIVTFLGRGAVGEVYEAEDLELGETVAVKLLRPEIARDERVLQRFKREIQLARRVTHPNVCRVFDLVYHYGAAGSGAQPERVFLTMELLRGQTLEQRLAREGRLTTADALPVIGHMAAALAAAHATGVVHRDLKSGNVFLVPIASGTRAVVTDFGLAWSSLHQDSAAAAITVTGELVGSPAYMAPEQVRGEDATPATDIYALGVVMFEMITGELPFVGQSAFYTALKRLQEPAPSPRVHLSDLDPAWEKTILRCLERDPADRFPTVRHVVRSLGATKAEEDATSPLSLVGDRPRLRPGWRLAVGLAAGLLLAAGVVGLLRFRPVADGAARARPPGVPTEKAAAAISLRPSIAVLPLDNLSDPRRAAQDRSFFELLPQELGATGKLRAIPPEEVELALRELSPSGPLGLPRFRQLLGADFLVTGALLRDDASGRTRYDLVVRDARDGRTVATLSDSGENALEELGARLRARLGAGGISPAEAGSLRALRPNRRAAILYAEAHHRLRRSEAPAALDLLKAAVQADPENPLLHSALSRVWSELGYREQAVSEAKEAFTRAATLRPEDRLAFEARYHETAREWERAAEGYARIADAYPDDLEAGLRLAMAQLTARQVAEAEETLARLGRLPPPLGQDARIDLAAAVVAAAQPDHERHKAIARRALRKALSLGSTLLAARARLEEGKALSELRDLAGAARTLAEAKRAFMTGGDPHGAAEACRWLGLVRSQQNDLAGLRESFRESVKIYRRLGAEGEESQVLSHAGNLHAAAGDVERAESFYQEALALVRKIGDRQRQAAILHNLGALAVQRGRLPAAKRLFTETLRLHRELGFAQGEAATLQGLATIARAEGDLLSARLSQRQALDIYGRLDLKGNASEVLNNLADMSFELGDLESSRRERKEARDLAHSIGQEDGVARAVRGIADVTRQEGNLTAARALYEQSLAAYRKLKLPLNEAVIQDEIGVTLTLQGELIEALKRFQQALATARQTAIPRYEAEILADQGLALHRYGEGAKAREALQRSMELSRSGHEPRLTAKTLVTLGHIQRERGDLAAARRSFEEALAIYRPRGARSGVATALHGLGEVALAQRDLVQARQRHEEALVLRAEMGEQLAAAESRLALAGIALDAGSPSRAENEARSQIDAFRKLGNAPGEAAAALLLARSLLAQGRTAAARDLLQGAAQILDTSQLPVVRKAAAELRGRAGATGRPPGLH